MTSLTASRHRHRVAYLLAVALSIVLGLVSRRAVGAFVDVFGKYPGDALWSAMVFFGMGVLRPRASTLQIACLALAFSIAIEALKLHQAPWIVAVRHTVIGHLVFGHVFSVRNLVAYVVGVIVAAGIEMLWPYACLRAASRA